MTEPLVDLRGLLRGLHSHRVDYVVFGAVALAFYGYVRNSEDLDVIVARDDENLNRVAEWADDMEVPVLNRRTLIDLKRRRGSNLDLADIEAIELLDEL